MSKDLNMYRFILKPETPKEAMVYAANKAAASNTFRDFVLTCEMATPLEIAAHVRAGLPIIGEPTPPDPNQTQMLPDAS